MSILYYFCQEVGLKPGPDYGKLKAGKPVEFEGVLLKPEDFLGITVNSCKIKCSTFMNGFTPFVNGRCQSLLQSTRMGSDPLLIVDVKVYYSQRVWVHTLC